MRKFLLICSIFFVGTLNSIAQEMWGISNSNYAGNMGLFLNPSSIVGAAYKYDINLIAIDVFAQNNYVYVPANRSILFNALTADIGPERILQDNLRRSRNKAFAHLLLIGPSYIRNKDHMAWGIHTAYRNELSILNVPSHLSKFIYEKYAYPPGFDIRNSAKNMRMAWMGWAELGATYATVLRESEKNHLKAGITANVLFGMHGAFLNIRDFEYTVPDSSQMIIHRMDATFAHSANPSNEDVGGYLGLRGLGIGTSMGLTFTRKRQASGFQCNTASDHIKKYHYRVGVSLMDLGIIHYFRQSSKLELQSTTDRVWNGVDAADISGMYSLDTTLSARINGNYNGESKNFSMITPTAISVQFDYSITPKIYANASWVNRLYFSENQVARANQLALAIRYEKRKWEANANVSLFEYQRPAMGIGFRYAFLIAGTDRILEWVNLSNVYSFDFYFGLKLNLCNLSLRNQDNDCSAY